MSSFDILKHFLEKQKNWVRTVEQHTQTASSHSLGRCIHSGTELMLYWRLVLQSSLVSAPSLLLPTLLILPLPLLVFRYSPLVPLFLFYPLNPNFNLLDLLIHGFCRFWISIGSSRNRMVMMRLFSFITINLYICCVAMMRLLFSFYNEKVLLNCYNCFSFSCFRTDLQHLLS